MSDAITSLEDFRSRRKRKTIALNLPDLGFTVHILKGTWGLVGKMDAIPAENLAERIALILVTPEGERLFTTEESLEELREWLTVADMSLIMQEWAASNGVTKEAIEQALKNSGASPSVVSESA